MHMSKYRYILTLVLTVFGLGTMQAQMYDQGDIVSDIEAVAGSADGSTEATPVVLISSAVQSWNPGSYISPTGFKTTMSDACVYEIYATGETITDDYGTYATYRIWNVSLQKWLREETYDGWYASDISNPEATGVLHAYTDDIDLAYECTILHTEENSENPRTLCSSSITCDASAFVLAEVKQQEGGQGYFGSYTSGFFSRYTDTNQWSIYEATPLAGDERLAAFILAQFPNGLDYYSVGTGVGCLTQEAYDALNTAYTNAQNLIGTGLSDDEVDAVEEALTDAILAAQNATVLPEAGKYYFIINQRSQDGIYTAGATLAGTSNYTIPTSADTITVADAPYIWGLIDAGDGQFYVQNYSTQQYCGTNSTTSGTVPVEDEANTPLTIELNMSNQLTKGGLFNIYSSNCPYHLDASLKIVKWSDLTSAGNLFQFVECTEDLLAVIADEVAQARLNAELLALYSGTAAPVYYKGRAYTGNWSEDGNFDDAGLVVDGACLWSNADDPSEGGVEKLVDGDFTSFFHSSWHSSLAPAAYHYMAADLGTTVENITFKYAKRHNNQTYSPTKADIYATNDTTSTWAFVGSVDFEYPYTATVSEAEKENFVGVATIELGSAYRFVRFDVTEHATSGGTNNGYPYWYLSELRYYDAAYDASNSPIYEGVSEATRTSFESAISNAIAAIAAGNATQALIDDLQAATDAFIAEYADPQILSDSIAIAQAVATSAADSLIGDALGLYPQAAVDALQATIDEVNATVAVGMSMEAINSGIAALDAALATFRSSYNLPEVGGVYAIRGLTTVASNSRALNAAVYAQSNSSTLPLKSQAQDAGTDPIGMLESLNFMWKVEAVSAGSIMLRNLGTNFYLGTAEEEGDYAVNVAEPTTVGLEPINMSTGGFNIKLGDGIYLNFAGQAEHMCAWSDHEGWSNSSLQFEPIDVENWDGSTIWPITPGVYQIITLPFAAGNPNGLEGTAFQALGQYENAGAYTIELQEFNDNALPAGTPIVYMPDDATIESILVFTDYNSVDDIVYTTEGLTTENGALTGVIVDTEVTEGGKVVLDEGASVIIGGKSVPYTVTGNTGYFNYVTTETAGDASITLSENIVDGISTTKLTDANALVDVYTISGVQVRKAVKAANATNGLPKGIYVVGGEKTIVK